MKLSEIEIKETTAGATSTGAIAATPHTKSGKNVGTLFGGSYKQKKKSKKVNESVKDDHEVVMARSDLYKTAKYAIKLHTMLAEISEEQGLPGWMQSKITKAADYISSVYHSLDHKQKFGHQPIDENNNK